MNTDDQNHFLELFFSASLVIVRQKNPDYAPDGIPLLDAMQAAVDMNITVPQVLWSMYRKHLSAIRKHFSLEQPLTSEPVVGRLQDAANYCGLFAFYETFEQELHAAWKQHWEGQSCECPFGNPYSCDKCLSMRWLERQAFRIGYARTSAQSTQKGPG